MRIFILFCSLLLTGICRAHVFDTIKTIPASGRMQAVQDIYNRKIKASDSVSAIRSIQQLIDVSRILNDRPLQCFSTSLLADHYARIRGFNEQSTRLHEQAITLAKENHLSLQTAICTYRMGRYYYNFKKYPQAFEYLLRADDHFRTIGYKDVPDIDEILYFMAGIYYETGNDDRAEVYLQDIQELPAIHPYVKKQSLNTLALISRQRNDIERSLNYFQKTLQVALAEPDSVWVGISYANIASLHFLLEQYEQAYPLFGKGYGLSIRHQEWPHAYLCLLYMARIDILRNQLHAAGKKIDAAVALHPLYNTLNGKKLLYETQVLYYEAGKKPGMALRAQNLLMAVKDSIAVSKDQKAYREIQLRLETEKHLNAIGKLEAETRAEAFKRNGIIAILALSLIVLFLWYRNYRVKAQGNAAILQADKLRAEEKLKYARQLLQNFTENTKQKNDLIVQFAAELEKIKASLPGQIAQAEKLQQVEKLMQSNVLSDEEWKSFNDLFEKVHKGFFQRLSDKFPGISAEEARLITLLRLGISERETGNMMGITAERIEEVKQALKKKMNLGDDIPIEELVKTI